MAEKDVSFGVAFREAGGVRKRSSVPYPITYEHVRQSCEKRERLLRIQFPDDKLDPEDEAILASLSLDDPTECWIRWDYLKGLWHAWERGLRKSAKDESLVSWQLQYREPVRVRVGHGRIALITSRSRMAMIRMARHDATRRVLGELLDALEVRIAQARLWKHRRRLRALADRIEQQWELHFCGVLANALSETGRAALPEEAPEWWPEVSAEDEAKILLALIEVGPGRFDAAKKRKPAKSDGKEEELDFGALLRMWEPKLRVPPFSLEQEDFARTLHGIELSAPAAVDAELEDVA